MVKLLNRTFVISAIVIISVGCTTVPVTETAPIQTRAHSADTLSEPSAEIADSASPHAGEDNSELESTGSHEILDPETLVYVPERDGDTAFGNGELIKSIAHYANAMSNAIRTEALVPISVQDRIIAKIGDALSLLTLVAVSGPEIVDVGDNEAEPFVFRVQNTALDGIAGIPVVVRVSAENDPGGVSTIITSSNGGEITIQPPIAEHPGALSVSASVDYTGYISALNEGLNGYQELIQRIISGIEPSPALVRYRALPRSRGIPTGILVLQADRGGLYMSAQDSRDGLRAALETLDYEVIPLEGNAALLGIDDRLLVPILQKEYADTLSRVILATAHISDFQEKEGSYLVEVAGDVRVIDLSTGDLLYSTEITKSSRASSSRAAVTTAFKGLGREVGQRVAEDLN